MKKKHQDSILRRNLTTVLNAMCREGASNTPDFILGRYLLDCLKAFERATAAREEWWEGKKPGFPQEPIPIEGAPEEPAPGERVTDVNGQVWERRPIPHADRWSAVNAPEPTVMLTWEELCRVGWTRSR